MYIDLFYNRLVFNFIVLYRSFAMPTTLFKIFMFVLFKSFGDARFYVNNLKLNWSGIKYLSRYVRCL